MNKLNEKQLAAIAKRERKNVKRLAVLNRVKKVRVEPVASEEESPRRILELDRRAARDYTKRAYKRPVLRALKKKLGALVIRPRKSLTFHGPWFAGMTPRQKKKFILKLKKATQG